MRRNGNTNINRTFNPQNTRPPIPLDVDEVDAVLERFIRQKYDQQLFSSGRPHPAARNDTGSTRSSDDQPPPLPPKPGKRFGFGLRSASSAFPLGRNSPASPPRTPEGIDGFGAEPLRVNKQSRVFGASVGGGGEEMEAKLSQLKDMGFTDEKRNAHVLKGLGGNLERTIEALVRLGEGSAPTSRPRTPSQARNGAIGQPLPSVAQPPAVINAFSFAANNATPQTNTGSYGEQPQQSTVISQAQASRSFSPSDPYQSQAQTHNPFDISSQQQTDAPLEKAFSGMQISQQPLFPHATGGYPSQTPPAPEARFQTMTPPVPQMPQQYIQSNPYIRQNITSNNIYNPFVRTTHQNIPVSSNSHTLGPQTSDTQQSYNPFQQYQPTPLPQQPMNGYSTVSPQAYSPQFQQQNQQPQNQQQQYFSNPYEQQHSLNDPAQYPSQIHPQTSKSFNQFQAQPLQAYQTGRIDKSSILALYNYPQLAPPPLTQDMNATPPAEPAAQNLPPGNKYGQRSVTMPLQLSSGSRNPFQSATGNPGTANGNESGPGRHVSQESVDLGGQNGRHSPDAFANLSARFVR